MPIEVRKYSLESYYTVGKLPQHELLKSNILALIDEVPADNLNDHDEYYNDTVTKLDWNKARDFTRPWTILFKPYLQNYLDKLSNALGYQSSIIDELWYQQYSKGDTHGWHTHGSNFTGVYYLELLDTSPKTELILPSRQNKKIVPDIREGDILMFPSYTIHRAPIIQDESRKTIISFNFVLDLIDPQTLANIELL